MVDPLQSRLCQAASRTQSGRMVEHPGFRLNPSNKDEHRFTHSLRLQRMHKNSVQVRRALTTSIGRRKRAPPANLSRKRTAAAQARHTLKRKWITSPSCTG